jgi:hypothetical protein
MPNKKNLGCCAFVCILVSQSTGSLHGLFCVYPLSLVCEVAGPLCVGDEQTPSLVEKLYSQNDAKVTEKVEWRW